MSTRITIDLPDDIYQRVEQFARLANRDLPSIVAESLQLLIPSPRQELSEDESIAELSDDQILALTKLEMTSEQDSRLSLLLDHQQSGLLAEAESTELQTLMQIYKEGLLRKATALEEAVKRHLIESLGE